MGHRVAPDAVNRAELARCVLIGHGSLAIFFRVRNRRIRNWLMDFPIQFSFPFPIRASGVPGAHMSVYLSVCLLSYALNSVD